MSLKDQPQKTRNIPVQHTPAPGAPFVAVVRIVTGLLFLWAFLDKTFGFGYATPAERA